MAINRKFVLVFLLADFIVVATGRLDSTLCSRSCGRARVNFPFGFSDGCHFRLNCSSGSDSTGDEMQLAGYRVNSLTSDSIVISLPAKCDREVDEIKRFYGENYAVSWQNALLLQNCSLPLNGCPLPTNVLESRFQLQGCDPAGKSKNMSCFAATGQGTGFLNYDDIRRNCAFLVSSFVIQMGKETLDVSLQYQTLQLEWWLPGICDCSHEAECTSLKLPYGSPGYRCSCRDGFTGDGFAHGSGCRKASRSGRSKIAVLAGGITVGASTVGLLVFLCYFIRRRSPSLKTQRSTKRLFSEAAGDSRVVLYPYKELERATCNFSEHKRLGTGAYGTVYEGRLHNNECVAIKKIKNHDTNGIEQVMNEIKLISSVSHPNLVRLLGCCIENDEQILVYEFMENGTLSQHLQREKGKIVLPWTVRLTIAAETAQAIAYLHSSNPPIYHRDIKSSNILLDFNYNPKVADFGLSRLGMTELSHISTAPQGTPGYVDPQYHQNYHLSDKSDVYSFGVVLIEIITAMKVVDFSRSHTEINLATIAVDRIGKGRLDEIIDPGLDPNKDAWTLSSIHKVAELAFRCLAYHRDMRPSMMEVAEELEQTRLSGWASVDDLRSVGSCRSSSVFNGSERSAPCGSAKGGVAATRRQILPALAVDSKESSPSGKSLLGNVIQ